MIRLVEEQVYRLLEASGIPTVPYVAVYGDARPASLPAADKWVLKAQLPVSSRLEKGLVLFAEGHEELEAARDRLRRRMQAFGGGRILIQPRVDYETEYYLSIVSDPVARAPVLLFSPSGGSGVETGARGRMYRLRLDILNPPDGAKLEEFFTAHGIRARGPAHGLARIAGGLYGLYREWDCRFIELNPLVLDGDSFRALDAKMEIDSDAFFRVRERLAAHGLEPPPSRLTALEREAARIDENDHRGSAHFVQLDAEKARLKYGDRLKGIIGFDGVGTGVSLTAMDELVRRGYYPRNFCDTSGNPPASKLYEVTKIIFKQKDIQGYLFLSCISSQQLDETARGVIGALKEVFASTGGVPPVPSVFVFRGAWDETARNLFEESGILKAPHVRFLGRETTERGAVEAFDALFREHHVHTHR